MLTNEEEQKISKIKEKVNKKYLPTHFFLKFLQELNSFRKSTPS